MAAVGLSRLGRIGKEGWKPWFSASKVLKSHIGAVREVIPNDPAEAIASSGKRCGADNATTLQEPATNQLLYHVVVASSEDAERAVQLAKSAQEK